MNANEPGLPRRMTAVAVAINLAITLPLAYLLNVWQDDAYTLNTTGRDLSYALHQAIFFEQNAPLYFLLMTVWRHINDSYFFARLFSVLCAAATIYLIPKIARRYVPNVSPAWITFSIALNPFLIWAALEIRLYAFVILISALLLVTFYDAFIAQARSPRAAIAYGTICVVALYTQYYLAFLILAQGFVLLVEHRRALVTYFCVGLAVAVAFLPMAFVLPAQLANFRGSFAVPTTPLQPAKVLAEILLRYVLPLETFAHYRILYGAAIAAALLCAVLLFRVRQRANMTLPIMTLACFVIFSLAIYASKEHVLNRHAAMLFVPVVLSVYAVFGLLREPARTRGVAIWTALVILCSVATLFNVYRPMAKPGDWARVTSYIAGQEHPNQPIVIFQAENEVPFAYYYRGPNKIIAVPAAVDFGAYNVDRFVLRDEAQVSTALSQAPGQHDSVWLITAGECSSLNINFGCDTLEHFVAHNYIVDSERDFFGAKVRLLRRKGTPRSQ
jgi:hypothetical protein